MFSEIVENCLAVYVQIDDHKTTYETAEKYLSDPGCMWDEFESDEDRRTAIETNHIVSIQVYWNTPVAFCVYSASSLDKAISYAINDIKEDELK